MYSLNNILFENFGIIPGTVSGSNIAVSGMLNMPARIGKTFHDWTGDAGIEPYVLASEIRHGGRIIEFAGLLIAANKEAAYAALNSFQNELDAFNGLVPLVTPRGTHQVFIQEAINAKYLGEGWIELGIIFQEPVVPNVGALPVGNETFKPHMDGVAFHNLGMFLSAINNHLNRPKTKDQKFTAYESQGFQITPPEALEFEIELVAYANSYAGLKANIQSLHKMLAAPGMRTINVDGSIREVFNIQGFRVTHLKVSNDYAVCRITVPLLTSKKGTPVQLSPLQTNSDEDIVSNLNLLIQLNS